MKALDLNGLIPATLTPMTETFQVDEAALIDYIHWMLQFDGLKAVAVNMDTGEGPHLTCEEKKKIVSLWKKEGGDRVPVLTGVSGPSTANAVNEARDAEEAGADGIVVFPIPAYIGTPLPPDIPVHYHEAIAASVDIPMVLFQLQPSLGGIIFEPQTLKRLLDIDSVVAIKEASFDVVTFTNTAEAVADSSRTITLLTGNDNFILESFLLGADGALIGFGTIAISEQIEMIGRVQAGDVAEAMTIYREKVLPLANGIFAPPVRNYRARLKEALTILEVIKSSVMRPPLCVLDTSEREAVRTLLRNAGMSR
jgi:4-hydroxy-tetrahydrodipicolinate synthase